MRKARGCNDVFYKMAAMQAERVAKAWGMHTKASKARHPYAGCGISQQSTLQHPGHYTADAWGDGPPRAPGHCLRRVLKLLRAACERKAEQHKQHCASKRSRCGCPCAWKASRLAKKAFMSAMAQQVPGDRMATLIIAACLCHCRSPGDSGTCWCCFWRLLEKASIVAGRTKFSIMI